MDFQKAQQAWAKIGLFVTERRLREANEEIDKWQAEWNEIRKDRPRKSPEESRDLIDPEGIEVLDELVDPDGSEADTETN